MTRDEAIKLYDENTYIHDQGDTPRMIDRFVKLGMLKLDEPKSVKQRAEEAFSTYLNVWHRGDEPVHPIIEVLDAAGLRIVEK